MTDPFDADDWHGTATAAAGVLDSPAEPTGRLPRASPPSRAGHRVAAVVAVSTGLLAAVASIRWPGLVTYLTALAAYGWLWLISRRHLKGRSGLLRPRRSPICLLCRLLRPIGFAAAVVAAWNAAAGVAL
ncbi:hypothetical protein [Candidatus Poriferisodalis sp.]|uniref:hypothetical protein n=1 Tax=Candidatus Poriferisodalis sp. TaxID=3101277 RepID=UPI003B028CAA